MQDLHGKEAVKRALETLAKSLPDAFDSSITNLTDIETLFHRLIAPLVSRVDDQSRLIDTLRAQYEEVLYRLETENIIKVEMDKETRQGLLSF